MSLDTLLRDVLGDDLPVRVEAWDGSGVGPTSATTRLVLRSPEAIRRIVTAPGELGFARAYVAGDLDLDGDVFEALALRDRLPDVKLSPRQLLAAARTIGLRDLKPLPPPPEEARLRGRRHSKARDAAAIAHHYDVGNDFYRLVLGPTMTYSCAVFERPDATLEEAQTAKLDLVCRKLDLHEGQRLLDVGCGWGSMAIHAASTYGVRVVGVTLSRQQQELAAKRVAEAGVGDLVEIRYQDYRDVADGPYDAISSIGMFEHVGEARMAEYFGNLLSLLRPGGRLLNHGISRPPGDRARFSRGGFVERYVFPDGELLEVGRTVSAVQRAGFEVRHLETLREHYALTLRRWVANLEESWAEAVALAGEARARIWRLYMAGSAVNFEAGRTQVHQILAVKADGGDSGTPLRPWW